MHNFYAAILLTRRRDQASGSSDVAHDLEECRDTLGSVLEAARSVDQQMQALKLQAELGPVLFALSVNQRQAVQDAFSCTICKGTSPSVAFTKTSDVFSVFLTEKFVKPSGYSKVAGRRLQVAHCVCLSGVSVPWH